ncbi:nucleotidyltransferase family protein [Micromonospora sp. NBC_01638]|uniref:nucleotidyltransferase family protein n=1 Tax=Micromonospora sp. NBC_01638 TaxID=2975982 RepID=UPI00386D4669|nr:nucleotidyltransferase family protein [Micromonospora sp. NBC_01638]
MRASPGLALRCLALDALAVATSDVLRHHGVDSMLLKGAGLARRLDTDRLYADVDLLVAPDTVTAAQDALLAAGYRPKLPPDLYDVGAYWHEQPWHAPGPLPLTMELHRGFAGVGDYDELWRSLRASAQHLDLAGGHVLVPDAVGAALIATLHAASPHGFGKPARDLARALEVLPPDAWEAAGRLAVACDAVPAFTVGLGVLPAGVAVATRLGLSSTHGPSSAWLAARLSSPTAVGLAHLAELSGPGHRLRALSRLVLPSPVHLRQLDAGAHRGRWGLLWAYARRIGRHVGRLPRVLRELRTARRRHHA